MNKEKAISLGQLITQRVLALSYKSTLPTVASDNNKILEVEGKPLRAYYELNHNPAKGETAESELRRWLLFLYTDHKIKYFYKDENDCFYFKSEFCMLDGIERVPTWAEMENGPRANPTNDC